MKSNRQSRGQFIPALRFSALTRFYDPLMATVLRESAWKAELIEQVGLSDGMRVLDLGCGTGTLTVRLARWERGAHVVGVDADPDALERARKRIAESGAQAELLEARAEALPFEDSSFDRVVSSLLFHHLTTDGKRAALAETRRVLRPDGELHIADWGPPAGLLMRAAFLPVRVLDGFETTSDNARGALPAMIASAGFERVEEIRRRRTAFGTLIFLRAWIGRASKDSPGPKDSRGPSHHLHAAREESPGCARSRRRRITPGTSITAARVAA